MDTFVNVSIIVLTLAIGTISVFAKIKKTVKKRSRLTFWGYILILATTALVLSQIYQIHLNEEKDLRQERAILERDSLGKIFILKNNESIIQPFAEGLRKYGLKYDTAKRRIEQLVADSIRKVVVTEPTINPEFSLCNLRLERNADTLKLHYEVCATQAAAYDIDYNLYFISRFTDNYLELHESRNFKMPKLLKDSPMEGISRTVLAASGFDRIYIYAKGTYKDFYKREYKFDRIMWASPAQSAYLTDKEYKWIKHFLKQKNID